MTGRGGVLNPNHCSYSAHMGEAKTKKKSIFYCHFSFPFFAVKYSIESTGKHFSNRIDTLSIQCFIVGPGINANERKRRMKQKSTHIELVRSSTSLFTSIRAINRYICEKEKEERNGCVRMFAMHEK